MSNYQDKPPSYAEATGIGWNNSGGGGGNGNSNSGGGGGGNGSFNRGGEGGNGNWNSGGGGRYGSWNDGRDGGKESWNSGYSGISPSAPPARPTSPPQDELSMWFSAVDEDGNGHITAEELRQALLDDNCRPFSLRTCRMLVRMFDDNSNGEIELSEFTQLFHYVHKWRQIFLEHDADLSGSIEVDELLESLNTVHAPLSFSRQFCGHLLHQYGKKRKKDGEYSLGLDSFIALNAEISRLLNEFSGKPEAMESFLLSRLCSK